RPGPPGTAYTLGDPSTTTVLPAVIPGPGLGPTVLGVASDMITVLFVDPTLPLDQSPVSIADDGSYVVVAAGTVLNDPATAVQAGDIILFTNTNGTAIQVVSGVSGQQINFDAGDWFHLNQRSAPQGTILKLKTGSSYPTAYAQRVEMVSYYLDNTTTPN